MLLVAEDFGVLLVLLVKLFVLLLFRMLLLGSFFL